MNKAIGLVIAVLVVIVSALFFNSYRLSNQVEKTEAELVAEQATNTVLGNIIDAYGANDAANRAATTRQLENERKLRNASELQVARFKAAAASDDCAIKPMSGDVINIMRE
ncbi:DUF2570 domain-containing protein [Yersinia enterocolitica]|uniref:DUF2570 domain-containing protein n=1 Tax=Yersinia enterocolitica TaxID=630 RepID=A0AAD2V2L8_YEREN|nr:DUF2570 domain-containing protein [Yersinia enterocolitica]EKN3512102.1 DUF2570 domain-containing protein [Yersinia enterocolitica]EKN3575754.1 DUF2570 domain-containing protein [Yersinia enterocolitica]EKN3716397.1 DUF2570 domain-containing protein [Yersinia enterocolitica]EKN3753615.1 DUF2570 domain-containing protein [Yersinia enterocolitica]EKN3794522.1 DUF2570 domain-containing protein [Yersinia enterocolitica]